MKKKEGISSFYINDKYIVHIGKIRKGKIKIENHCNKTLFVSEQELINQFSIVGDILLYSSYNEDFTRIYNLNSNKEIVLDVYFYGVQLFSPYIYDNFYYNLSEYDNNFIYDLQTGKVVFKCINKIQGTIQLNENKCIVTKKDTHIYTYQKSDFSLLWQKDIREIASYTDWDGKHQGNIKNAYLFEDKLIVTAGGSVLALNIENGEILWQVKYTDFQPLTLHINGKYAYLARGVFYSVIDLETGEKLLETMLIRPFDHDKKYEKANLAMVGSDMTFYDNYLYFSDKHKGQYYLAKLNPHTGKIEDFQFLEGITSNLHPPKFYENKMFLQDNENNLFIYEKI